MYIKEWTAEEDALLIDIIIKESELGKGITEISRIAAPYLPKRNEGAITARWYGELQTKHPNIKIVNVLKGWTNDEDFRVVQYVLDKVANGQSLTSIFKQLEDIIEGRSQSAIAFRWHNLLKKKFLDEYEEALRKKQNKMLSYGNAARKGKTTVQSQKEEKPKVNVTFKRQLIEEPKEEKINFDLFNPEPINITNTVNKKSESVVSQEDFQQVTDFIEKVTVLINENKQLKDENQKLSQQNNTFVADNTLLKAKVNKLECEMETKDEDYKAILSLMDKARKMMLTEENSKTTKVESSGATFKMDKNGNLNRI